MAERLTEARERRGLTHRQIADATKLSSRVVAALEDDRIDQLPEGIYRRALVRAVAREVGLDAEEMLKAFLAEHPDDLPAPGAAHRAPEPSVRAWVDTWRRVVALAGAAVPMAAGVVYFGNAPAPRAVELPPAVAIERATGGWRPEIVPAGGFSEAPPPAARPVTMLISVSARCHLRVVADGGLFTERTLEAGEWIEVAFSREVELTGDNAGVVQYSLNGRAGRMLGGAAEPLSARIGRDDYHFFLSGR